MEMDLYHTETMLFHMDRDTASSVLMPLILL